MTNELSGTSAVNSPDYHPELQGIIPCMLSGALSPSQPDASGDIAE